MTTTHGQKQKREAMTNTNKQVLIRINEELKKGKKHKAFVLLSDRIKDRAIKLLGKTIRRNKDDPMREVIMIGNHWKIQGEGHKRSGRPKTNWLIETAFQAWGKRKLYKYNISIMKQIGKENKAKEQ